MTAFLPYPGRHESPRMDGSISSDHGRRLRGPPVLRRRLSIPTPRSGGNQGRRDRPAGTGEAPLTSRNSGAAPRLPRDRGEHRLHGLELRGLGKPRKEDVYAAGGKAGRVRTGLESTPCGLARPARRADHPRRPEASLRRLSHYDYWENKVRRSVLLYAKADCGLRNGRAADPRDRAPTFFRGRRKTTAGGGEERRIGEILSEYRAR
jgi:hypothetical protein